MLEFGPKLVDFLESLLMKFCSLVNFCRLSISIFITVEGICFQKLYLSQNRYDIRCICCCYRDNNIDELDLELFFTCDSETLGKYETFDLKPGGSEIRVTEDNKQEYLK